MNSNINRLIGTVLDEEDFKLLQPYLQLERDIINGKVQILPSITISSMATFENLLKSKKSQTPIEYYDVNFDEPKNQLELKAFLVFFIIRPEFVKFLKNKETELTIDIFLGLHFSPESILFGQGLDLFTDENEEITKLNKTALSLYKMEISELIQEAIKMGAKF